MLKGKGNDLLYLLSMLESLEKVIHYGKAAENAEMFFEINEQANFNASLTLLMHIGETVAKFSDDLLQNSSEIPWDQIRGLRNRIAHNYVGIDIAIIFKTIKENVPLFLEELYSLASHRLRAGILDKEELKVAVGNRYYRHINFSKLQIGN